MRITKKTIIVTAVAVALIAPVVYVLAGSSPLPAQTPPAGLRAGHAQIERFPSAAPQSATVAEQDARLDVAVPKARESGLDQVALRWRAWYHSPVTGAYTLVVAVAGPHLAVADVRVDGQRHVAEVIRGGGDAPAATAAGSVRLARGWHKIVVAAGGGLAPPRDVVSLSIRAPGTPTAVPLVPYWPSK